MRIAIITSIQDPAGRNIREALQSLYPWEQGRLRRNATLTLHEIEQDTVEYEHIDKDIEADIIVFATKHQSRSGIPSFSVHVPGNFGEPMFGGEHGHLCPAQADLMYHCLHRLADLQEGSNLPHEVVYEATHHGPATDTPTMFIEIGSQEKYWKDPQAGKIVAQALIEGIDQLGTATPPAIIGIGGLHTCPSFTKLALRRQAMVGHVCPVYMLDRLSEGLVDQMIEKTDPEPTAVVLDWKGLKSHKQHVRDMLEHVSLEIRRTKDYKS